jgi:hypothetical protein
VNRSFVLKWRTPLKRTHKFDPKNYDFGMYLRWVMEMNKSVIRLSTQISNSGSDINLLNLHRRLELRLLREFYHIELLKPRTEEKKNKQISSAIYNPQHLSHMNFIAISDHSI